MSHRLRFPLLALALCCLAATWVRGDSPKVPENPADISISVVPEKVAPGGRAEVTLQLAPIGSVKINRYPQIKLKVPDQEGLVGKAEAAIGSSTPLPIDETGTNYWKTVDPLHLTLEVDPNATSGTHEVEAKLLYFFCVSAEFCAPARIPLTIPIEVR